MCFIRLGYKTKVSECLKKKTDWKQQLSYMQLEYRKKT